MTGFEQQIFGIRSNRSANRATTTAFRRCLCLSLLETSKVGIKQASVTYILFRSSASSSSSSFASNQSFSIYGPHCSTFVLISAIMTMRLQRRRRLPNNEYLIKINHFRKLSRIHSVVTPLFPFHPIRWKTCENLGQCDQMVG